MKNCLFCSRVGVGGNIYRIFPKVIISNKDTQQECRDLGKSKATCTGIFYHHQKSDE